MLIAMTRPVSPLLAQCELTHLSREPIDVVRAGEQHARYEQLLSSLGAEIVRVTPAPELPDSVFIEDTAIVLDEVALITRPGAESRRNEGVAVASALARYRPLHSMQLPACLDGGDVLRLGRTLYVGRSERTNEHGIDCLRKLAGPLGYRVVPVDFSRCLHLKSAVTALSDGLLLANASWVSRESFPEHEVIFVDEREPYAANALRVGDTIVFPSEFPRTLEQLRKRGLRVATIDCGELAKAEGAVTCCSLIFEAMATRG